MPPNAILVGFTVAAELALDDKADIGKQLLIVDQPFGKLAGVLESEIQPEILGDAF